MEIYLKEVEIPRLSCNWSCMESLMREINDTWGQLFLEVPSFAVEKTLASPDIVLVNQGKHDLVGSLLHKGGRMTNSCTVCLAQVGIFICFPSAILNTPRDGNNCVLLKITPNLNQRGCTPVISALGKASLNYIQRPRLKKNLQASLPENLCVLIFTMYPNTLFLACL